jgi:hypothetical protein
MVETKGISIRLLETNQLKTATIAATLLPSDNI